MNLRIIGALLLLPLVDILILIGVAVFSPLGWVGTVAIVVLSGLVGMLLVRAEGRHTIRKIRREVNTGGIPADELLDGGLLIAAGAFLLTPGFVSDLTGLVLAIPVTRYPVRTLLKRYLIVPYLDRKTGGIASGVVYGGGFPDETETYDIDPENYDVRDGSG